MKKIILFLLILSASCASPQVTVTSAKRVTVTSPPLAATIIPTPTLHPQFIELQSQIAASGETFTLRSDGTIEQMTSEGAVTVPGLAVDKNGVMTLSVGDDLVILDPADVTWSEENIFIKGYTQDENGKWGVERPIKEFPICTPENFCDCQFDLENDIWNGDVDKWLLTLSKPFDIEKINNVPLVWYQGWGRIQYSADTDPNFRIPGSEQQHREATAGLLVYEENGVKYEYIFIPLEFYDPATGKSHWVKTVTAIYERGGLTAKSFEDWVSGHWDEMRYMPIVTTNKFHAVEIYDPLVGLTFQTH
ncbi:MAG: hypothetical protein ACYC6R_15330, partial [Anaerolineales bacterium]